MGDDDGLSCVASRDSLAQRASFGETSSLTCFDVFPLSKAACVRNDTLARKQIIPPTISRLPFPHPHRPNTIWIPERYDPEAGEHGNTRVSTLTLTHQVPDGGEDIFFVDTKLSGLLEVVGEDVEKEFGIAFGVDVPMGIVIEEVFEGLGVDEVAVLCIRSVT